MEQRQCNYNSHRGDAPAVVEVVTRNPKTCGCSTSVRQFLCEECLVKRFDPPNGMVRCTKCGARNAPEANALRVVSLT